MQRGEETSEPNQTATCAFRAQDRQLLTLAVFGLVLCLGAPNHANAMTIDFSEITGQWASIKTFAIFAASAIACFMIIMTIVKLIGHDGGEAIMYAAGAAICGFVATHAAGWISSETGATL
jgi:hypothetical protein